jgi:hypothetical protein
MSFLRSCIIRGIGLDHSVICPGKQALDADCSKVLGTRDGWRFDASVDLDGALRKSHANENRWDYGLEITGPGGRRRLEWVEFHPACSSDVETVIQKKRWLEKLLAGAQTCPRPDMKNFHWVASRGVYLDRARIQRLAQAGMGRPQKQFRLPLP